MKRGRIPRKDNVVMLTPKTRMGLLDDLKNLEDDVLKIKNILLKQSDSLLIVYNEIQAIHSTIRELGGVIE